MVRVIEPLAFGEVVADEAHETLAAAGAHLQRTGQVLLDAGHALCAAASWCGPAGELVRAVGRASCA